MVLDFLNFLSLNFQIRVPNNLVRNWNAFKDFENAIFFPKMLQTHTIRIPKMFIVSFDSLFLSSTFNHINL